RGLTNGARGLPPGPVDGASPRGAPPVGSPPQGSGERRGCAVRPPPEDDPEPEEGDAEVPAPEDEEPAEVPEEEEGLPRRSGWNGDPSRRTGGPAEPLEPPPTYPRPRTTRPREAGASRSTM